MTESNPLTVEQHFSSAASFLDALSRRDARWPYPRGWIYRGHSDAERKLVPSIFRCSGFGEYLPKKHGEFYCATSLTKQVTQEAQILHAFAQAADATGFAVPGFKDFGLSQGINAGHIRDWLPPERYDLAALAQHYGVPTRLLDWTKSPLRAAYFAASGAARKYLKSPGQSKCLALFGFYTGYVSSMFGDMFSVVKVARAQNQNLHAQEGLFTITRPKKSDDHEQPPVIRPFEELLATCQFANHAYPLFYKLTLDWSETPMLMQYLRDEGVTAASIYPGYQGAARAAEESVWAADWRASNQELLQRDPNSEGGTEPSDTGLQSRG